jgi:predicted transcriptional regulator of viral defense system
MALIDVIRKISSLNVPILQPNDVAALLGVNRAHASKILSRLAAAGFAIQLTRGRWVINENIDRLLIPEYLAAPSLCYISLQTALFHHGMISQIPETTYAVTTMRTRKYSTQLGEFSLHHVESGFFFGYDVRSDSGVKMATPEKALIDFLYLSPARSNFFKKLPEIELSNKFSRKKAREIIKRISSPTRRIMVETKFTALCRGRVPDSAVHY